MNGTELWPESTMRTLARLFALCLLLSACHKGGESAPAPASSAPFVVPPGGGAVAITASEKGFTPAEVHVTKGVPLTLLFTRTSDNTCATEVVFPELKLRRPLPLHEAVAVQLPTDADRTYRFQCGMAMWQGSVIVR
jgi:plastocyanin domain-containing protein